MFNEYEDCQYRSQVTEENQFYKKLHYKQIQYECLKNIQNSSMHVNKETNLTFDIESKTTNSFYFNQKDTKFFEKF